MTHDVGSLDLTGQRIIVTPNAGQHGVNSTVVVQPLPAAVTSDRVRASPLPVYGQCSHCSEAISTHISHQVGAYTWLWCGLLTLFG